MSFNNSQFLSMKGLLIAAISANKFLLNEAF